MSSQQLVTVAGAVVGGVIGFVGGGPVGAVQGAMYGATIGGIVGSIVFAPDPLNYNGPRLEDLRVQTSTYGVVIPRIWGAVRIPGNVIWSTQLLETATTTEQDGKGGGGGASSTTYSYRVSCAVGICRGEIAGIRRIYAYGKLIYDVSGESPGITFGSYGITIYTGTETQEPDPTIEADKGVGNVPGFRGLAYVVFSDFQLQDFGNRVPDFTFEVLSVAEPVATFDISDDFAAPNAHWLSPYFVNGSANVLDKWNAWKLANPSKETLFYRDDLSLSDVYVEARPFLTTNTGDFVGLVARFDPVAGTGYYCEIRGIGPYPGLPQEVRNVEIFLYRFSGYDATNKLFISTLIDSVQVNDLPFDAREAFPTTLRMEVIGTAISVAYNDEDVINATDSTYSGPGYTGIMGKSATTLGTWAEFAAGTAVADANPPFYLFRDQTLTPTLWNFGAYNKWAGEYWTSVRENSNDIPDGTILARLSPEVESISNPLTGPLGYITSTRFLVADNPAFANANDFHIGIQVLTRRPYAFVLLRGADETQVSIAVLDALTGVEVNVKTMAEMITLSTAPDISEHVLRAIYVNQARSHVYALACGLSSLSMWRFDFTLMEWAYCGRLEDGWGGFDDIVSGIVTNAGDVVLAGNASPDGRFVFYDAATGVYYSNILMAILNVAGVDSSYKVGAFGYDTDREELWIACANSGGDVDRILITSDDLFVPNYVDRIDDVRAEPWTGVPAQFGEVIAYDSFNRCMWIRDAASGGLVGYSTNSGTFPLFGTISEFAANTITRISPTPTGAIYLQQYSAASVSTTSVDRRIMRKSVRALSLNSGTVSLATIIRDVCEECGLDPDNDIDVSEIDDDVEGYLTTAQSTGREVLEPLQLAFMFYGVESDDVIKWKYKGQTSIRTLTLDDLGATDRSDEAGPLIPFERAEDIALPRQVEISYPASARDYQQSAALSRRIEGDNLEVKKMTFALVMTDAFARRLVEHLLYASWVGRTGFDFSVPLEHVDLDPGDVVTLDDGEYSFDVEIVSTSLGANGLISIKAFTTDDSVFASNDDIAAPGGLYTPQTIGSPVYAVAVAFDPPAVVASNNRLSIMVGARRGGGSTGSFPGAVVEISRDGGTTWESGAVLVDEATIGTASSVLAAGRTDIVDASSYVDVSLPTSVTLESITYAQLLAGGNAAMLGDELFGFQTATDNGNGTWRLSGLLRGRRGTEWATGTHEIGETFVLLDETLRVISLEVADMDAPLTYRYTTIGESVGYEATITPRGISRECFAPCAIGGGRGVDGSIEINWTRRDRLGHYWTDYVDAPLSEDSEQYELRIYRDAGYSSLARTVTGLTSPTYTYSAANIATDFGSPSPSRIYVKVAQVSTDRGTGQFAAGSI
jgi:hypothetical protein